MKLRVPDTHCHLFLIEGEPGRLVEAATAAGVSPLVCVGIDPESSRRSLELAEEFPAVASTAGMHPHTASELDSLARREIASLAADPRVVGIGETGLDFYRRLSSEEDQRAAFRFHAALSRETGKPMIVHVRDAWEEVLVILAEEQPPAVILHCYSGDGTVARECVARGYFLSFAGPLTYPKNQGLRHAAASVPRDRLLVETDSPYLPPQALRGRSNVPENVLAVVETLATVRGETTQDLATSLRVNTRAAFPGLG